MSAALSADADKTHGDALAGSHQTIPAQSGSRNDGWGDDGGTYNGRGFAQKMPATDGQTRFFHVKNNSSSRTRLMNRMPSRREDV
jgi:hypothetical protein